jgi:hypothetical protein
MTHETEGYEVAFNETMGHWYIVHRQMQGGVLHRNILSDHYESKDAAQEAADEMSRKAS